MFNPFNFKTVRKPHHIEVMFQGAIEPGYTLPRVNKYPKALAEDAYLVGYTDQVGCFSVRYLPGLAGYTTSQVDVAFYTDTVPNELSLVDLMNAEYKQYEIIPGWGFEAMRDLKEKLERLQDL